MCCVGSCLSCILSPVVHCLQKLPLCAQVIITAVTVVALGVIIWFLRALCIHVYYSL